MDYWVDHPPTHELVAAYLGVKPRTPALPIASAANALVGDDPSGIGSLIHRFPGGIVPASR